MLLLKCKHNAQEVAMRWKCLSKRLKKSFASVAKKWSLIHTVEGRDLAMRLQNGSRGHDFESPLVSVHAEAKKCPQFSLRRDKWLFKASWIEKRMVTWLFKYFSTHSWKENEVRVIRALRLGCYNISSCSSPTSWHYAELTQAYCLQYTYLCCCLQIADTVAPYLEKKKLYHAETTVAI